MYDVNGDSDKLLSGRSSPELTDSEASPVLCGKKVNCPPGLARVMWLAFEHDLMHLETILYMLVQSPNIRLPAGVWRPVFTKESLEHPVQSSTVVIPSSCVTLGTKGSPSANVVGWDNEFPESSVDVPAFEIQSRPVTNVEFLHFLNVTGSWSQDSLVPASWHVTTGDSDSRIVRVKTGLGLVDMSTEAQFWPVFVSAAMGDAYAKWKGDGWRLPTEPEVTLCMKREHPEGSSLERENVAFA
ncbi:hypothetical protein HDU93_005517, partial [Gonapodya sp. JEL0774]